MALQDRDMDQEILDELRRIRFETVEVKNVLSAIWFLVALAVLYYIVVPFLRNHF